VARPRWASSRATRGCPPHGLTEGGEDVGLVGQLPGEGHGGWTFMLRKRALHAYGEFRTQRKGPYDDMQLANSMVAENGGLARPK